MPNGGATFYARWFASRGVAGNSSNWEYQDDLKMIVVSGSGVTYDYELGGTYGLPPWRMLDVRSAVYEEGITGIGKNAFSRNNDVNSISLPSTLKSIGDFAFSSTSIDFVILPDDLQNIGAGSFINTPISSITLPPALTTIGPRAFQDTLLDAIELPANVEYIGSSAFYGTSIVSLVIPESVRTIENSAFSIMSLTSLTIKEGLEYMGANAFSNTSLTSVILPNSLKSIGPGAFSSCKLLKTFSSGDGIDLVPSNLFYGCISLESIDFGSGVKAMDQSVFMGCKALRTVVIPANMSHFVTEWNYSATPFSGSEVENIFVHQENRYYESVDGVLFSSGLNELITYPPGKKAETYSMPADVYGIGDFAFWENKYIKNVILSDTVLSIGKSSL